MRAVVRQIEVEGRAPRDELVEIAASIAGDTYETEESLWKNLITPALGQLDGIESEGSSGYWRRV